MPSSFPGGIVWLAFPNSEGIVVNDAIYQDSDYLDINVAATLLVAPFLKVERRNKRTAPIPSGPLHQT